MLNHRRLGSGEPLLLLHGIGMSWQWWTPCLDLLATRHEVVGVDFPGFGGSEPFAPGREPSPEAMADEIEALAASLGLSRPHVAGISMGGLIALELAARGSLASACAISPAGFYEGWERGWADASLRATHRLARAVAPHADLVAAGAAGRTLLLGQVVARGWRVPPSVAAGATRVVADSDYLRTLDALIGRDFTRGSSIRVPVTIAWGTRDRLLFPRQADRAVAAIRGARKALLRGCGHVPTYDDPEATARAILATTGSG